jgi:hypothetical protein
VTKRSTAALVVMLVLACGRARVSPTRTAVAQPSPTASARPSPRPSPSPSVLPSPTATVPPLPGRLVIRTTPAWAEVALDFEAIGRSPLEVDVSPGKHHLAYTLEGYETLKRGVEVAATEVLTVSERLWFRSLELLVEDDLETADEVKALRWHSNEQLLYLVGSQAAPPNGDLPCEWTWWSYDLPTQSKQLHSPSVAPISEAVLEDLGIVPEEGGYSVSPDGEQIIYTHFDGCQKSEGRFCEDCYTFFQCPIWRANGDGTNRVPLGILPEEVAEVYWSPGNEWAVIYYWFPEGPIMFYVAKTDGTFLGDLEEFAGVGDAVSCAYPPRSPVFSPDGKWMAIQAESRIPRCTCGFWVVNLEERSTAEMGRGTACIEGHDVVQWSKDSVYLYWLKGEALFKLSGRDSFANVTMLARGIRYRFSPNLIAVSPDETMIAMGNLARDGDVIIVQFAPR